MSGLLSQLDYVYFLSGLGMVLLGCVSITLSGSGPIPTPWWLLAGFALADGASRWVQLVAWSAGDAPALTLTSALLAWAAGAALLEFARRTHRLLRWTDVGPWIHVALGAAVFGALLATGVRLLDTEARLFLIVPGAAWTAWLFHEAARRTDDLGGGAAGRRARLVGSVGFALLAAAAVAGPVLSLLHAASPDATALAVGRSVVAPLVVAAIGLLLAVATWSLSMAYQATGTTVRKRALLFGTTAAVVAALAVAGWLATDALGRRHQQEAMVEARASAARVLDHLTMEMTDADAAARAMSVLVGRAAVAGQGRLAGPAIDDLVETLGGEHPGSVILVVDAAGAVVSSTEGRVAGAVAGREHGDEPHVRQAMEEGRGRHVGVDAARQVPGYHAGAAIRDAGGRAVGVAVVQHDLDASRFGPPGPEQAYLVGADGRILVWSGAGARGGQLWPAEGGTVARLQPDGGAGGALLATEPPPGTSWTAEASTGARRLAVRASLPLPGWSLVILKDDGATVIYRLFGILVTLLLGTPVLVGFVMLQRQLVAEDRLAFEKAEAEVRAEALARQADTDTLTGLRNRLGLNVTISRELARARRHQQPLAVMFLDLDHFKRVNDTHGHPAGDQVLVGVARLLESHVRESDTVARWGGEEFMIVAPMTQADGAVRLGEKLRSLIAVTPMGPAGLVTASIGVAELGPAETIDRLLQRADEALYRAKSSGRNRVELAEPPTGARGGAAALG